MTRKLFALAILPMAAGSLVACGGGGGRSASPPAKPLAAPSKAHFLFLPRSESGALRVADRSDSKGVRIEVSTNPESAEVVVDHSKVNSFSGPSVFADQDGTFYATDTGFFASLDNTAGGRLSFARFGTMADVSPSTVAAAGHYSGELTQVAEMPKNTTATYLGSFIGYGGVIGAPAPDDSLLGNVQLNANFASGTINGQVSDIVDTGGNSLSHGLSMNGKISGNTYAGKAGFTTTSGDPSGTVTTSAMTGGFYGPKAQETAGALRVEGKPGSGQSPVAIVGAFGAKRQ